METSDAPGPLPENTNENENLIKAQQENDQQNIEVNQYFVESNKKYEKNTFSLTLLSKWFLVLFLAITIFCSSNLIIIFLIGKSDLYKTLVGILPGTIISLKILIFSKSRLKLTKDKPNNKVIIKVINFLCFPIEIIKIDIDNFQFKFSQIIGVSEEGCGPETTYFSIANTYKNLRDIDLDTSNIQQKPAKFVYSFPGVRNINNGENKYTSALNAFLGRPFDNKEYPSYIDIYQYMYKNRNKNNKKARFLISNTIPHYMKYSEHLFTYYLSSSSNCTYIDVIMLTIFIITNILIVESNLYFVSLDDYFSNCYGFIIFLILNIILYAIYKCLKKCCAKISRFDWIYSRNFDRIFIGLVKSDGESYASTFDFPINNIDRYILEKISYDNYDLVVMFKNNEKQFICNFNKNQEELEGLAYLLNEKLNITKENMDVATSNEEI